MRIAGIALLASLVVWSSAWAAEAPPRPRRAANCAADGKTDVRLRALNIELGADAEGAEEILPEEWMSLSFQLVRKDREIIRLDGAKSRVTEMTDDAGTNFLVAVEGANAEALPTVSPQMGSASAHAAYFEVHCARTPAARATRLTLKADLMLVCGADEREGQGGAFAFKKGARVKAGPFTLEAAEVEAPDPGAPGLDVPGEPPPVGLILKWADVPGKWLKAVRLLDRDGKEIPLTLTPVTEWPGDAEAPVSYCRMLEVRRNIAEATLAVTWFDRLEEVVVPMALSTGVGF